MTDAGTADTTLLPLTTRGGLGEAGLRFYRSVSGARMRSRWTIDERGVFRVPDQGPVIFASNHIGWMDGPLLIALSPRPSHALVKAEAFTGFDGLFLRVGGQIKIDRNHTDVGALRRAVKVLRAGQAVTVWPEGTRGDGELRVIRPGIGYLALVSGAPVVPVAIFGTRRHGEAVDVRPEKGQTIEIMYGDPLAVPRQDWPRQKSDVDEATERIADHLRGHLAHAKTQSHIGLPGPVNDG